DDQRSLQESGCWFSTIGSGNSLLMPSLER
ncbi:unnamed protein product, partial [Adineta steineri]